MAAVLLPLSQYFCLHRADIAEGGQDKKIYSSGGKGDRNCKLLVFAAIVLIVLVLLGLGIGLGTYYGLKSSEVKLANNIYKSDLRTLLEVCYTQIHHSLIWH